MTMGIARAVARQGVGRAVARNGEQKPVEIDAVWVDGDGAAMDLGRAVIARAKDVDERAARIAVRAERADAVRGLSRQKGPFDVIVCGQVLSEMHRDEAADARVAAHAAFLADAAKKLAPDGSLVVIEPALRERARHLHAVREALVAQQPELGIFAPCLHRASCPMLATPGDWCHEDLPVDLPAFLVPLAKAAGLRWQGLTFSYLVLRRDGLTLRAASGAPLRLTSSRIVTKGKIETFVCGELGGAAGAKKLSRLDRDESEANAPFGELERGDLVRLEPEPGPNGRLSAETHVRHTRYQSSR
jgi:SAM-dependent methyltransferase